MIGGFYFTLLTTAGSVIGVRKLFQSSSSPSAKVPKASAPDSSAPAPKPFSDELTNRLRLFMGATGVAALATSSPPVEQQQLRWRPAHGVARVCDVEKEERDTGPKKRSSSVTEETKKERDVIGDCPLSSAA